MKERSPITTHVLDVSRGKAAAGVAVVLEQREASGSWKQLSRGATNADGRMEDLLKPGSRAEAGAYRLTFESDAYFRSSGTASFYPQIQIIFQVTNPAEHHHVPLLLSPFGYSTYRGT
jgi:5-hydroxyisourate hydrolase